MQKNSIILFLFLLLFAGACYTSSIPLNVLVPATASQLDQNIQSISLLPVPGNPSAPGKFEDLRFVRFDTTVDIQEIKMGYLHGMYDVLYPSPLIKRIIFSDSAGLSQKKRIYWDELKNICRKDSTDYIMILNQVLVNNLGPNFTIVDEKYNYEGDLILINFTKWSVYDPIHENIVESHKFSDTTKVTGGFSIDYFSQLLYENCYNVGKHCGERISPHWKETTRLYYSGPGKDLRDASEYVNKSQWYKASRIWNDMMTGYGNLKTANAAYNLAVAFEQNDDIDQALAWLNYSDSLKSNKIKKFYVEVLKSRKSLETVLDNQLFSAKGPDETPNHNSITGSSVYKVKSDTTNN